MTTTPETETSRDLNGHYPWEVPYPGEPQCAADGVRNGPDGPGGTEHYWTCTAPGTVVVDGELLCAGHAEEYGHDPDGGNGG